MNRQPETTPLNVSEARVLKGGAILAVGLFSAQILGFLRQVAIGYFLGTGGDADAFTAAMAPIELWWSVLGAAVIYGFVPKFAQGVLTGKYLPGAPLPSDSRAADDDMGQYMGRFLSEPVLQAVQDLKPLAAEAGLSLAQFALAWVLREPNVASAIIGASRPAQVVDNAAASDAEVDPALFAEAERIVAEARR